MDIYDFLDKYPDILNNNSIKISRNDIISLIQYYIDKDINTIKQKIDLLYHNLLCYKNYTDIDQYLLKEQTMYYLIDILSLLENNIIKNNIDIDSIINNTKLNINDKEVTSIELNEDSILNFFIKYSRGENKNKVIQ